MPPNTATAAACQRMSCQRRHSQTQALSRIGSMKPTKISCGLGAIRRAQSSGSAAGALAGWGGLQVSTTDVPCPGAEMISALPPASDRRLGRCSAGPCSPVRPGPDQSRSRRRRRSPSTPPARLPRAVTTALRTPAWAATLRSASPAAALSASAAAPARRDRRRCRTGTSSSAADSACAAQRGPQVGEAVSRAGHLPGQCVLGPRAPWLPPGSTAAGWSAAMTARSTLSTSSCTAFAARRSASSAARAASCAAIRRDSASASASARRAPARISRAAQDVHATVASAATACSTGRSPPGCQAPVARTTSRTGTGTTSRR